RFTEPMWYLQRRRSASTIVTGAISMKRKSIPGKETLSRHFAWHLRMTRQMFNRAHHQKIAIVLTSLDAELLRASSCYFGGGTAITLRYGEFRESVNLDFLISDLSSYRYLRQLLTGPGQFSSIL